MKPELGILSGGGSIPHPSATIKQMKNCQNRDQDATVATQFDVLTTSAELEMLENDWHALFEQCNAASISKSFAWSKHAWEKIAKNRGWSLAIVVGRIDNKASHNLAIDVASSFAMALS